jgi:hypothetical protein
MEVNVNMSNFKLDSRTIIIGLLIIAAAIFVLPRLFDTSRVNDTNPPDTIQDNGGQTRDSQPADSNADLGRVVSASSVNRDECPTNTTSTFEANQPIYVVAQDSSVEAGTTVFVRLYHEGQPIEDAPEITADRDYNDTCISFVFEPEGAAFEDGSYEAEFIVNGNKSDSVAFEVR